MTDFALFPDQDIPTSQFVILISKLRNSLLLYPSADDLDNASWNQFLIHNVYYTNANQRIHWSEKIHIDCYFSCHEFFLILLVHFFFWAVLIEENTLLGVFGKIVSWRVWVHKSAHFWEFPNNHSKKRETEHLHREGCAPRTPIVWEFVCVEHSKWSLQRVWKIDITVSSAPVHPGVRKDKEKKSTRLGPLFWFVSFFWQVYFLKLSLIYKSDKTTNDIMSLTQYSWRKVQCRQKQKKKSIKRVKRDIYTINSWKTTVYR